MNQESKRSQAPVVRREDFGPGKLGEYCYKIILRGETCQFIIDDQGTRCGERGIGTTDFDFVGDATILVHCSQAHHEEIMKAVEKELVKQGRNTVFGTNGFGREKYTL